MSRSRSVRSRLTLAALLACGGLFVGCAARPAAAPPQPGMPVPPAPQAQPTATAAAAPVFMGPPQEPLVAVLPEAVKTDIAQLKTDVADIKEQLGMLAQSAAKSALAADAAAAAAQEAQARATAGAPAATQPAGAPAVVATVAPVQPPIVVEPPKETAGDVSLKRLMAGNARFVAGTSERPNETAARRAELATGQKPFAIVLGCADSRVSPEVAFDAGLGDLFVCRVAGNVVDDPILGSIEYAVQHLDVPLVVVLGHERCGAVKAAADALGAGGGNAHSDAGDDVIPAELAAQLAAEHVVPAAPAATATATADAKPAQDHIGALVELLRPSINSVKDGGGDVVDNAVAANAKRTARLIRGSRPVLNKLVKAGKVKVVAARYDLDSGEITLLDAPPTAPGLQTAGASDR